MSIISACPTFTVNWPTSRSSDSTPFSYSIYTSLAEDNGSRHEFSHPDVGQDMNQPTPLEADMDEARKLSEETDHPVIFIQPFRKTLAIIFPKSSKASLLHDLNGATPRRTLYRNA